MREKYESLSLTVLKELAKARGMKKLSGMKKSDVIEAMLRQDEAEREAGGRTAQSVAENTIAASGRISAENAAGEGSGTAAEVTAKDASAGTVDTGEAPAEGIPVGGASGEAPPEGMSVGGASGETPAEGMSVRGASGETLVGGMSVGGRMNGAGQSSGNFGYRARQGQSDGGVVRQRPRKRGIQDMRQEQFDAAESVTETGRGGYERNRSEGRQAYRNDTDARQPYRNDGEGRQPYRNDGEGRQPYRNDGEGRQPYRNDGESRQPYRNDNGYRAQTKTDGDYRPERTNPRMQYGAVPYQNGQQGVNQGASFAGGGGSQQESGDQEVRSDRPPVDLAQLDSGLQVTGILEVMADGFGFIRSDNYLPGENDVYVSPSQIRKFNLKTGDIISGNTRIKTMQEKFSALLYLRTINGRSPAEAARRYNFEDMTPIFPNERLCMERGSRAIAMRIVDLLSPIGKGQRGMIVSPPKAGKTTLLKDVARSILENDPKMKLIILLIDERPEEVTDIREAIQGENVEVIYSTFDELPEHHKRVSEMVIERAKRLVEHRENVTILLDSITRLARAYNLTVPPSGRTLSGGLDPAALHMPKRFFGAARNMREGGSLTILATALVDTGSKMDDVVYEEFKGTGNMELVLDRKLSEKRVFPAIDIQKSGTRREDLLLDREEQEAVYIMRRALNGMKSDDAVENILNMFVHTKDNRELVQRVRRQKYV